MLNLSTVICSTYSISLCSFLLSLIWFSCQSSGSQVLFFQTLEVILEITAQGTDVNGFFLQVSKKLQGSQIILNPLFFLTPLNVYYFGEPFCLFIKHTLDLLLATSVLSVLSCLYYAVFCCAMFCISLDLFLSYVVFFYLCLIFQLSVFTKLLILVS